MKKIYLVTEGKTDNIVIEGLVSEWLGSEDYLPRHIQPPSSDFIDEVDDNLSEGWKGVVDWCQGERSVGPAGRDEALEIADCLFIHIDADVAYDQDFKSPVFSSNPPSAANQCDWVRAHIVDLLGGTMPHNVVLCVPPQDLETWVLTALHPDVADAHQPIELKSHPASLLVSRAPYKLVRRKDGGRLKKDVGKYEEHLSRIVKGWGNCTDAAVARSPQALRFELEAKLKL